MRRVSSSTHDFRSFTPEELLGPLNEFELKNAPARLWIAGDTDLLKREPRVSIVGSRTASHLGISRARRLARILAEHSVPVVSGLARGIDTSAHRSTIEAGGKTIAVLGTPLNRTYPAENADLQREIMENHLAISQFPVGAITQRSSFPIRNRTMALISRASVIVEAGETSGSLSQGWEALRLGRLLFIMESIFKAPGLTWPKKMEHYGAEILREPEDLLEALSEVPKEDFAEAAF